ncbi:heavy metal-binding domain-containing protein [Sediminicola luteus]|uniref:heavy metal-binding domain-containing protein n=1 Tax=Sediminicola luteus TaxID=319238 RepID=UPI001C0F3438|nr:heavy metal-binding domain-containing protein [Sediminicola luteus]
MDITKKMSKWGFLGLLCMVVLFSCKEGAKTEKSTEQETEIEQVAEKEVAAVYQCPMDCEKGKAYAEKGSCPVCKMDLALLDAKDGGSHEKMCQCAEGECKCGGKEKCKCGTPGYDHKGNKIDATAHADDCQCKADGECKCEDGKCKCTA